MFRLLSPIMCMTRLVRCIQLKLWVVVQRCNMLHPLLYFFPREKEKDGTEVIGNIIHCKMQKSRMTKENKMVDVLLTYRHGLSKYYGLLEMAEAAGIIQESINKIRTSRWNKIIWKTNPQRSRETFYRRHSKSNRQLHESRVYLWKNRR